MKRKADIDRAIAAQTNLPLALIRLVTTALVDQVVQSLALNGVVHLDRLGRFTVSVREGGTRIDLVRGTFKKGGREGRITKEVPYKVRVEFKKATELRRLLAAKAKRKSWRIKHARTKKKA